MEQQSQGNSNNHDQKIAELEARLNNANQIIANLQKQNIDFQKNINALEIEIHQFHQKSQSRNNQSLEPGQKQIKSSVNRRIIRKYRVSELSDWQFYGLTSLVIMSILLLFGVGTLLNNQNRKNIKQSFHQQSKNQTSASSQLNLSSPLTPPNIPVNSNPIIQTPIHQSYDLSVNNSPELVYNLINPPSFKDSEQLNQITQELTKLAKSKNLSVENLSISLIDVNKQSISGYKQKTLRYPASVVKLFWMVNLEAQISRRLIQLDNNINSDLQKMILKSDNNAASQIVDTITHAQSLQNKLNKEGFTQWKKQRQSINRFFQNANYQDINISQKTFPIPDLKINEPQGTDLQIRGDNPQKPIRNKITTYHAARLMYEIATQQAVAPEYSQRMLNLLIRDLRREAWKFDPPNLDEFNPVENFLGEGIADKKVQFASKAGWTTSSRQEVAYIATSDGKTRYILAIFGDDPAYGKSKTIFPQMSKLVFDRMTNSNR
jgi:beta-lactamase class A